MAPASGQLAGPLPVRYRGPHRGGAPGPTKARSLPAPAPMTTAAAVRTCECGCGSSLRHPRSHFAPGHNARVSHEGRRGLHRVLERTLCRCGCGRDVKYPAALYVEDHYRRQLAAGSTEGTCAVCGKAIAVKASRGAAGRGKYCSRECFAQARRGSRSPRLLGQTCATCSRSFQLRRTGAPQHYCSRACYWADLRTHRAKSEPGRFLLNCWRRTGVSMASFARSLGITPQNLSDYLKGRQPRRRMFERLNAALGGQLTDSWSAEAKQKARTSAVLNPEFERARTSKEAHAKTAAKLRGGQRPKEVRDRISAVLRASERHQLQLERLHDWSRSASGRATKALFPRLRAHPHPTRADRREWALHVAQLPSADPLTPGQVLELWRPHLDRRGLWSNAGRKANEERHDFIDEQLALWPKGPGGRRKKGVWTHIEEVARRRGLAVPEQGYSRWLSEHRSHCRRPEA